MASAFISYAHEEEFMLELVEQLQGQELQIRYDQVVLNVGDSLIEKRMSHAGPLVIRSFDLGRGQADKDRQLDEGSPVLAVFVSEADHPDAWLATGQALQRVLLRARTADVWSSFLNQPVEVPELRPRLATTIGRQGGYPQLVVRLGYGPQVKPEPRSVEEAVWEEAAS